MDNLLEFIVPLVFAAIYFFGNMLSKKGDKDEDEASAQPRSGPADAEAEGRQRSVQEEIRRKIMERRQGTSSSEPARETTAYDQQQRERRQASDTHRERRQSNESQREQREVVKKVTPPPVRRQQAEPPPMVAQKKAGFDWDTSDDIYGAKMEQQLKRIEATKRKAAQLKKKSDEFGAKPNRVTRSGSSSTFSGSIRSQLQDPTAARAAFIYAEIIGRPVSAGKPSSVPGLG